MGAPVGDVAIVDLPVALIAIEPRLSHFSSGLCHGSLWIPDCTERLGIDNVNLQENRIRWALLATLYSWVKAGDSQFIYRKIAPHLVYSVDHGYFFPDGPNWSINSLMVAPLTAVDSLFQACSLQPSELGAARLALDGVHDNDVAAAVAGPPDQWGIGMQERVALAEYLIRRKTELLTVLPYPP